MHDDGSAPHIPGFDAEATFQVLAATSALPAAVILQIIEARRNEIRAAELRARLAAATAAAPDLAGARAGEAEAWRLEELKTAALLHLARRHAAVHDNGSLTVHALP